MSFIRHLRNISLCLQRRSLELDAAGGERCLCSCVSLMLEGVRPLDEPSPSLLVVPLSCAVPAGALHRTECVHFIHDNPSAPLAQMYAARDGQKPLRAVRHEVRRGFTSCQTFACPGRPTLAGYLRVVLRFYSYNYAIPRMRVSLQ